MKFWARAARVRLRAASVDAVACRAGFAGPPDRRRPCSRLPLRFGRPRRCFRLHRRDVPCFARAGQIKPSALVLNILGCHIGAWQFWRAGHFSWRLFWPFAVLSIPMAFVGGYVALPTAAFKVLVGTVLLLSPRIFSGIRADVDEVRIEPSKPVAIAFGGVLGLFAGLTGTGGGIFLTPLLLVMFRWARTRKPRPRRPCSSWSIPSPAWPGTSAAPSTFLPSCCVGDSGHRGRHGRVLVRESALRPASIKRLLATVLVIAGLKLVLTA